MKIIDDVIIEAVERLKSVADDMDSLVHGTDRDVEKFRDLCHRIGYEAEIIGRRLIGNLAMEAKIKAGGR